MADGVLHARVQQNYLRDVPQVEFDSLSTSINYSLTTQQKGAENLYVTIMDRACRPIALN